MKTIIFSVFNLFFIHIVYAQTPSWAWAKSAGSAGNDYAGLDYGSSTISTDWQGNSYITGTIGRPTTFGSITLTAPTYPRVFVAKYNANGVCLWARQFGGNSTDIYGNKGEAIDIDLNGNCYVTGTFNGSAGSNIALSATANLTGTGYRQIFMVKYNSAGNVLWARQPAGNAATNHYAKSICVDLSGNSYITGYLGSTGVQFGSTPALSGPGAYVAKYNTSGVATWSVKVGNNGNLDGASIDVDICSNVYLTGYFQSTETFPFGSMNSNGMRDVFLAKVTPAGALAWVKSFGSASNQAYGRGLSTDHNGNVFITGDFQRQVVFGATTLSSSGFGNEMFVAKFDLNGNVIWAKQSTQSTRTEGHAIKTAPNGDTYVTGFYQGNNNVSINGISLTSNGNQHIFVTKFDSNGNNTWAQNSGYVNTGEASMGISLDAFYNIYISGYTQGAAIFGSNTVTAYGGYDILIAKLKYVCP